MSEHFHAHMDRNIFKLNLPVEVTSAYILVASLVEQNIRPSMEEIKSRWTKSEGELDQVLGELAKRNIIKISNVPEDTLYYPNPSSLWRWKLD
ncbi:MAG: hypothetical protein JRG97_09675 [Deltaproteobacteria bacterium]|nr:hypothetical protein [Deltaproteobacteria bacterium]MBW2051645.1 hypothetical protein [Deltaproteobacteria bacterium]MBW2141324.1 hypothetical protein [Deltaproteobacteria bacterium]MBW2322400.1 hypothetical protein [Deltaproteobacteria bacterium]